MKHTEGKWSAKDCIYSTHKRTEIWSEQDKQEPIFEIIHREVNLSECSPNAKLISKAPEMYELLKKMTAKVLTVDSVSIAYMHSYVMIEIEELLKQIES